jgi:hypothetical protein
MVGFTNIGGSVVFIDATDFNHIDISINIGGILTVTAHSPKGKRDNDARFVDAVNRIRG